MRHLGFILLLLAANCGFAAVATNPPWEGEWITDLGVMELTQSGSEVTGTYSESGSVAGTDSDHTLTGVFENKNAKGTIKLTISDDGRCFTGSWRNNGNSGRWRGWKSSPDADMDATRSEPLDFSGAWLSSNGIMLLNQENATITGTYGTKGWGNVKGEVTGGTLEFEWKYLRNNARAWLQQSPDGTRIFGRTLTNPSAVWTGARIDDFSLQPAVAAGKTVRGRTSNGMLYFLRMPDDWKEPNAHEGKLVPTDVIVLLHGSNWTTQGMVHVLATKWPDIGKRFAILGIQGERWAEWSETDDLRFNYSYINWMGRSTYRGFPNTDRESPYLVMKAIDELNTQHQFGRVFAGGHSQGGYLTYLLHMHFPEKLAGTFPVAGGLVMQAEPDVFDDESLKIAQRATPMAIVHGTNDRVVSFTTTQHIERRFLAHDFHSMKVFSSKSGHPFDFLPIGEAVEWLDTVSTTDPQRLLAFANDAAREDRWRDVAVAISRWNELSLAKEPPNKRELFDDIKSRFEAAAGRDAEKFETVIAANENGEWIDDFLAWKDNFATAHIAKKTMTAFQELRSQHEAPAKEMRKLASKAHRAGNTEEWWSHHQSVVDKYYASTQYRTTKAMLVRKR